MAKKKVKIIPRLEWVLVQPIEPDKMETSAGLIVPNSEGKTQKSQGTVISVGSLVEGIQEGDMVVYGTFAGEDIQVKNGTKEDEYKLLMDEDIIAFIK